MAYIFIWALPLAQLSLQIDNYATLHVNVTHTRFDLRHHVFEVFEVFKAKRFGRKIYKSLGRILLQIITLAIAATFLSLISSDVSISVLSYMSSLTQLFVCLNGFYYFRAIYR